MVSFLNNDNDCECEETPILPVQRCTSPDYGYSNTRLSSLEYDTNNTQRRVGYLEHDVSKLNRFKENREENSGLVILWGAILTIAITVFGFIAFLA